jgi:hypothetical protein
MLCIVYIDKAVVKDWLSSSDVFSPSCRYGCPSLKSALCGENYLDGYDKVRHLDLDDVWFVL